MAVSLCPEFTLVDDISAFLSTAVEFDERGDPTLGVVTLPDARLPVVIVPVSANQGRLLVAASTADLEAAAFLVPSAHRATRLRSRSP